MKDLISANELRIGNLYNDNGVFKKASPSTIEEVWNAPRSWCKPIPLTEEWLLKFGFEKTEWYFNSYRLVIGNNDYAILIDLDGNCEVGDIITCKIEYVHQLQNLYFALKGEELTFKTQQ